MREKLTKSLISLAEHCPEPLYLVGGSVRDYLAGTLSPAPDWDLASPMTEEKFLSAAQRSGLEVRAVYPATGTVKLKDGEGAEYEFTRFRSDTYVRGMHAPAETEFTRDIKKDAVRRDFCANAVYYDIQKDEFIDPLGGIPDIQKHILRTVAPAKKVFGEDGLRLMRLARIAAETGFSPDEECLEGARANHMLIRDIVPERIFQELCRILSSDEKTGGEDGPYRGLCLLRETGVLNEIAPELALGDGLDQRKDFHKYDVLEHSLRCVRYAPPDIRFAALLHDVGKPYCFYRDGNFHAHPEEGARIAGEMLSRWKAPKKLTEETKTLILLHMRDFDLNMRESKVRRELIAHYPLLKKLFALKQADFSACRDDTSPAPTVVKWEGVLQKMKAEGAPLTLSELAVTGKDALNAGIPPHEVGNVLHLLLFDCALSMAKNERATLLKRLTKLAQKYLEKENICPD